MDLKSSAETLGTEPQAFLEFVQREKIKGILRLDDQWRVSIFTLADLLNTSTGALLELMEDYALGELIEEAEGDELFEGEKEDPFLGGRVQKLAGYEEYYKMRFGSYRVGLWIDLKETVIEFRRVRHRKDIYRRFP
jgi:mRNA-degrading endonuclease RelE of RelBE toxin-antitoxin system